MKTRALPSLILLALLMLAFIGCKPVAVSVEDRIALFLSDINNQNWSSIYLNFHPTLTSDYNELNGTTVVDWGAVFPQEYSPYSITGLNTSDPRNVTGSMTSSNDIFWGGPQAVAFRMAQNGEDWMIEEMDLGAAMPLID